MTAPAPPPSAPVPAGGLSGGRRTASLRRSLTWLFAALFVPLLLLGTALLVHQWNQQQELALAQLRQQADALRRAVEREVALDLAVLGTVASVSEFDRQDWPGLHTTARQAARNRPASWMVAVDTDGQYLVNTLVPLGTPLPNLRRLPKRPVDVEWKGRRIPFPSERQGQEPMRTSQPVFTGLVYGPMIQAPIVIVTVPVVRDATPRYTLSLAYSPGFYGRMLESQSADDGLLRVIFDADGRVIARSAGGDAWVGRHVSPPFDKGLGDRPPQGSGEAVSLEGTPVFYAYSRASPNGWVVGVATPREAVLAPARRSLAIWVGVLLATGGIGAAAAHRLWRRLARPLAALADQARVIDAAPMTPVPAGIEEIEVLHRAMLDASHQHEVRRRAERERERAESHLRRVIESAPIGMVMVDARGTIALVNRQVEAVFGYSRDELLGRPVDRLVPTDRRAGHGALVAGYFQAPTARAMGGASQLHGVRKDGSLVPVEIGLVPIETADGRFALASIVDISTRKRAEDELRRSNQDLEQFAYVASHDLQEPLRMVANYTELLAERYQGQLDERADRYIHYAVDGAKRMQRLVADLLAYSRVGSQAGPLVPVDAAATMDYVLKVLRATLQAAGAAVEVGPLPTVLADEGQLTQVFQNLIGNAVKFRGEPAPHIVIGAERVDGGWRFSVRDNGIGFEPQYAERVFQMFQRLHERGRFEGSGIGLAIVKRIVERHGGRIEVESRPGAGTTFRFTLPAAPGDDTDSAPHG